MTTALSLAKHVISFPCGAAGNHVRWLLFLDKSIHNPFSDDQSIDGKIKFIKDCIYPADRTWNNWLTYEWDHREQIDDQLALVHEIPGFAGHDWQDKKIVFLKINNINAALRHYFHINLGLNNLTPELYQQRVMSWNNTLSTINNTNLKLNVIDIDQIFNKELDIPFYENIIHFFNLSDNYKEANLIQNMYYNCRCNSAAAFYNFFTGDEFNMYLNEIKFLDAKI